MDGGGHKIMKESAPMGRSPRGFTLVELLVVITIIGILVGLIIPAVNMVREDGRQTVCMSNQIQLGKAILGYEQAKNHLPGVLDLVDRSNPQTSPMFNWVEVILPNLEHGDLWDRVRTGQAAQIQTMHLDVTACPDDPYLSNRASVNYQALLSYGVNDGFFVMYAYQSSNKTIATVDRNGYTVAPVLLSKLTCRPNSQFPRGESVTSSTTIMLGERTGDGTAKYPRAGTATAGKWTDVTPTLTPSAAWNSLTFPWTPVPPNSAPPAPPTLPAPPKQVTISPYMMVSAHPGKVVVVFFDGHGEKVANDALYPQ
jgi:prepilin-type N-terminal cleavage/methylation domain-containing protein/prepilin-type processing-associated H-X9-DG protein